LVEVYKAIAEDLLWWKQLNNLGED